MLAQVVPFDACDANLTVLVATPDGVPAVLAKFLAMASFTAVLILASLATSNAASNAVAVAAGRATGATESCTHHVSIVCTDAAAIECTSSVAQACPALRVANCLDGRWASMSGELWLQAVTVNHFADDLLDF